MVQDCTNKLKIDHKVCGAMLAPFYSRLETTTFLGKNEVTSSQSPSTREKNMAAIPGKRKLFSKLIKDKCWHPYLGFF